MSKSILSKVLHNLRTVFGGKFHGDLRRRPQRLISASPFEEFEQRCLLTAAIVVAPVSDLTTTEAGGTAQFTVVLTEQPSKTVKIPVKSSDLTEGTVSTKMLLFTKTNWNQPQTVTVKGVDDTVTDGNQPYTVVLGPAKGDKLYKKQDPADVSLTNQDNDSPSLVIVANNNLQTTEGAGTATFTIRLSSKPTAPVTVSFSSTDTGEGTVTSSVTFTTTNWNQPKTVTITGVNDSIIDGDQAYQIVVNAATSTDPNYAGLSAAPISVTNRDNDVAGIQISPASAFQVGEGWTRDVSVKLTAQPTADVTVTLATTVGAGEATLSTTTLTFTPENWNVYQTVTVTGVLGDGLDGNKPFAFTLDPSSADAAFDAVAPKTVNATIVEGDDHTLDGSYTGSYSGTVTVFGFPTSQNGNVAFTVVGNRVTVTQPAEASGLLSGGSGTFAPTSGPLVGGSFTGTFTANPDGTVTVSGTWTYSNNGNSGSGTWSATRPAAAP